MGTLSVPSIGTLGSDQSISTYVPAQATLNASSSYVCKHCGIYIRPRSIPYFIETSWEGLRLGFVEPSLWRSYPSAIEPVDEFFEQTDAAMFEAQERIAALGRKVVTSVPLAPWDDIVAAMPDFQNKEDLFRE